jgi:hypothetical protein
MPDMRTGQPEIVIVLWIERGHQFEVSYVDGTADRRQGSLLVATQLAERASLQSVPTAPGTARWARDPESTETATKLS